jgi:hypothetical protein
MGVTVAWERGDMGVGGHCVLDELQIGTLGDAGCGKSVNFSFLTTAFVLADMASGFDFTRLCPAFFAILVWDHSKARKDKITLAIARHGRAGPKKRAKEELTFVSFSLSFRVAAVEEDSMSNTALRKSGSLKS